MQLSVEVTWCVVGLLAVACIAVTQSENDDCLCRMKGAYVSDFNTDIGVKGRLYVDFTKLVFIKSQTVRGTKQLLFFHQRRNRAIRWIDAYHDLNRDCFKVSTPDPFHRRCVPLKNSTSLSYVVDIYGSDADGKLCKPVKLIREYDFKETFTNFVPATASDYSEFTDTIKRDCPSYLISDVIG